MSAVWNEGYFTDVAYTYGYYRDIAPVFQRFCLLLRGYAVAEPAEAKHCELGFGQGVSVNIHAAATPGQYFGTDFNPAHAAHAAGLAEAAGSGAQLFDDSFEQMLNRDDLPQFDSISLHGIWTWVSRDNHKLITEFARRHLKPGGVFYNSYNCFPGWSPAYPLRQLFALHDRFAAPPTDAVKRVEAALSFSKALLDAEPVYARHAPGLDKRLEKIMSQDRHYLAHEYLNREWNCMYFTDVVDALAPAKLDYACTAVPMDAVEAVNLSAAAQTFLATVEHPILREQARDYFVNQQFRKDLYLRGAVRLGPVEQRERLLATRFVLVQKADEVPMKVRGATGEAALLPELYKPVLELLASRDHAPKTLRELLPALQSPNAYITALQVLTVLVGMGAVHPCQAEAHARLVKKRCDALNRHLCEQAQLNSRVNVLASPVTGMGMPLDRFTLLFLLASHKKRPDAPVFVWDVLRANGEVLMKDGVALQGADANLAELRERYQRFVSVTMPVLKALGIA